MYNYIVELKKWGGKSMSPKTGRPKVNNPKEFDVKVRFDKETHDKILKYSNENNITKADTIRRGVNLLLGNKK